MAEALDLDRARRLLCALGDHIRDTVIEAGAASSQLELAEVAAVTAADTIYQIDKITAWVGYANPRLAAAVRPVFRRMLDGHLGSLP